MRIFCTQWRWASLTIAIGSLMTAVPSSTLATLSLLSKNSTGPTYAVSYDDGVCYAGFGGRLCIVNASFEIDAYLDLPSVIDGIQVQGSTAYLATWFGGLCVVDLSGVGPELVGTLSLPGQGRGLTIVGSTGYVASSEAGIRVVDISQPTSPAELGSKGHRLGSG